MTIKDTLLDELRAALGAAHVLTGADTERWQSDWTGSYRWQPLAVVRPGSTAEVAAVMRLASRHGAPVVPVSGNTGLSGGTRAEGVLMISIERLNTIRDLRAAARVMVVEAGVILSDIHAAAEAEDLVFPLTFGARGSARIGGCLATNAGGSNVLRYGNTRHLCLGLEVVLASGEVLDLMTDLHKDNSGLDLRQLFIGSEGILGIITAAVLKLAPKPRAYATAMVAAASLPDALTILNRLQAESGGAVEAFEYMPRRYIEAHLAHIDGAREPFGGPHEVNLMVELGATAPRDAAPGPDGTVPLVGRLEETLAALMEEGLVEDATVARNEAQRRQMWQRREDAAELTVAADHIVLNDVSLPVDKVHLFLDQADARMRQMDPGARSFVVSHLGDGNVHYTVWPSSGEPALHEAMREAVEAIVRDMRGSFSAEHGIGTAKLGAMARHKDPVVLKTMAAIKQALDPQGLLNPGKMLPG
ncbi:MULTISPECIES: FAD-binding oxidoreductase [unclassified Roseitalea]|uniref:FAD-binding oxidoreductase n=1 Tax=unclassified Roseitalea TaxID=2639107 RepID=UPI00273E4DB7|nr:MULTISPECIES: FAD-binding oxidoreductase [unclassified Roseitalea]